MWTGRLNLAFNIFMCIDLGPIISLGSEIIHAIVAKQSNIEAAASVVVTVADHKRGRRTSIIRSIIIFKLLLHGRVERIVANCIAIHQPNYGIWINRYNVKRSSNCNYLFFFYSPVEHQSKKILHCLRIFTLNKELTLDSNRLFVGLNNSNSIAFD